MKTNSLKHNVTKIYTQSGETYKATAKIRLDDECKNGHQDFSVTADVYRKGKNGQWLEDSFGCQHDLVLKLFPQFKLFVDLHLSDFLGAPMYPSANGFYHLQEARKGLYEAKKWATAQEYVRATAEEFETLKTSEDELIYKYHLENSGIVARWKTEAEQAIKALEELTNNEFVNDSTRTQYTPLTAEQRKEIEARIKSGYYTPVKIQERKEAKKRADYDKITRKLEEDKNAAIWKIEKEFQVDMAAHKAGLPIDNLIYYHHTGEAVFNWQDSSYASKITPEQFKDFIDSGAGNLTFDVTWKLGDKKSMAK